VRKNANTPDFGKIGHAIADAIMDDISQSVEDSAERDQLLIEYDQISEGVSPQITSARWQNACNLDYPLTMDAQITVMSSITQAIEKNTLIVVQSALPQLEQEAKARETVLKDIFVEINMKAALVNAAAYAVRFPFAVVYAGWDSTVKYERAIIEGTEYQMATTEGEGVDLRVPHPRDFYLSPPNSPSIDQSKACGERMYMTTEQLIRGVRMYGFDAEAVEDIITEGYLDTQDQEDTATLENRSGIDEKRDKTMHEVFVWYTDVPFISEHMTVESYNRYPDEQLEVICVPSSNKILRMEWSKYPKKPYVPFYIMPNPNSFYGTCITQMLYSLQQEANVTIRHFIDSVNFQMNPAVKMNEGAAKMNSNTSMFPGAVFLFQNDPNEIMPFETAPITNQPMEILGTIDQKAQSLYSAGGWGQMQQKVRKAAEVQAVQQNAASKFEVMLFNFMRSLEVLSQMIMDLYSVNAQSDKGGNAPTHDIPEMEKNFSYHSSVGASSSNPQQRIEMASERQKVIQQYVQSAVQMANAPQMLHYLWKSSIDMLYDLGSAKPDDDIGPDPLVMAQQQQMAQQSGQQPPQPGQTAQQNSAAQAAQAKYQELQQAQQGQQA
jgi:hypothetical protein